MKLPGARLEPRTDEETRIRTNAQRECKISDRVYELIFNYQERYQDPKYEPLSENERVGQLSLPLSRLYNQLWQAILAEGFNPRKKENKKQMEVAA